MRPSSGLRPLLGREARSIDLYELAGGRRHTRRKDTLGSEGPNIPSAQAARHFVGVLRGARGCPAACAKHRKTILAGARRPHLRPCAQPIARPNDSGLSRRKKAHRKTAERKAAVSPAARRQRSHLSWNEPHFRLLFVLE